MRTHTKIAGHLLLGLCLLSAMALRGAQFVAVTAEIEIDSWGHWFNADNHPGLGLAGGPEQALYRSSQTVHCVVGTNLWMLQDEVAGASVTRWFTGTNLIEYKVYTNEVSDDVTLRNKRARVDVETAVYETADGNPGRQVGDYDLLATDLKAKAAWLAFCSGTMLKMQGRTIYPTDGIWKKRMKPTWSDKTRVYKDELGLPKSLDLIATTGQTVFEYRAHTSTNVLGWNFPQEFYSVQYAPNGTNTWQLHLTVKGRVTSIGETSEPVIPAEVLRKVLRDLKTRRRLPH